MEAQATQGLLRFFRIIPDPRAANARHVMSDILSIAILAVLCGSESWAAVECWGQGNLDWLSTFLELPHGIPSHDTFDRVFAMLDPLEFEKCFNQWVAAPANDKTQKTIAPVHGGCPVCRAICQARCMATEWPQLRHSLN
jgi:hypothetical protein